MVIEKQKRKRAASMTKKAAFRALVKAFKQNPEYQFMTQADVVKALRDIPSPFALIKDAIKCGKLKRDIVSNKVGRPAFSLRLPNMVPISQPVMLAPVAEVAAAPVVKRRGLGKKTLAARAHADIKPVVAADTSAVLKQTVLDLRKEVDAANATITGLINTRDDLQQENVMISARLNNYTHEGIVSKVQTVAAINSGAGKRWSITVDAVAGVDVDDFMDKQIQIFTI